MDLMCHQCRTNLLNDVLMKEILHKLHRARAAVLVITARLH